MAVKIRLTRLGDKKAPFYRIVVADSRAARDAKYIELVGTYNPLAQADQIKIDAEKALKWINNGAQPTETVKALLKKAGVEAPKKATKAKKAEKSTKKTATKTAVAEKTEKPAAKKPAASKTKKASEAESNQTKTTK